MGIMVGLLLAAVLSTGVEIPDDGVPMWNGSGMQFTTRTERRPAAITNEAAYLKWKWRMNLANPATGLDNDALRAGVKKIVAESGWKDGREDWYDVAARCFDFIVDNVAIGFSKYDCFPAISAWDRHERPMKAILWSHAADVDDKYYPGLRAEIAQMRREGRAMIGKDFDHSAPDWVDILKLGFPGMKARVDSYTNDTPFYRAEKRAAAAMMRFLDRLVDECKIESGKCRIEDRKWLEKEIASLERLRVMKRLLPQLAAMGVGRIVLVGAKKVEKDFWGATLLKEKNYRPLLVDGLMQAGTSILPTLETRRNFRRFVETELDALFPTARRIVAHPYGAEGAKGAEGSAVRPLLAIGHEGGWTDDEVALLESKGFARYSLGPRILRTDTATVALIARLQPLYSTSGSL